MKTETDKGECHTNRAKKKALGPETGTTFKGKGKVCEKLNSNRDKKRGKTV